MFLQKNCTISEIFEKEKMLMRGRKTDNPGAKKVANNEKKSIFI
jgi:hypothetical protein